MQINKTFENNLTAGHMPQLQATYFDPWLH